MAVKSSNQEATASVAYVEAVDEIMRHYKSLPARPSIEEVEAAVSVIKTVDSEEQAKLEEISKQEGPQDVPHELFSLLQDVRRNMVLFQSREKRREAVQLVQLDKMIETFDGLIQRASLLVSGGEGEDAQMEKVVVASGVGDPGEIIGKESVFITDESLIITKKEDGDLEKDGLNVLVKSSSIRPVLLTDGYCDDKFNLMKVAAVIETTAKSGAGVLDLKGKLMDQIEWLPLSIGKLSAISELDLSENRLMALPTTMSSLQALTKLDVHSNQLINLPDSIGELINLIELDLHANRLKSLPASFGNLKKLRNLDLSSNQFTILPENIGDLISLETLNVETNELEELPYTIGGCSSLVELRLDFNLLKALPEAIGKLGCLEILTLHYNRIQRLPTTMGNLTSLRELDVSFNELESVPENVCFAVRLKKLNVANNFADLRALPRNIGNLEMLEELDISDDQIRALPESFRFLSNLRVFRADETPLELPPRQITKLGAQAVVQFMADHVAGRITKSQTTKKKKKGFWSRVCLFFWPHRRNSQ